MASSLPVVDRAPSAATLGFLAKLGCTEQFDSQSAASAKIEELLRNRDLSKVATDAQHRAVNALGGKPMPSGIHREVSKVIAVLTAIERIDLSDSDPNMDQDDKDQAYVDALVNLADVCRREFAQRPSVRAAAVAASRTTE